MAFCNSCGASLPPGAAFCEKCGKPVAPGGATVSSTIPAATSTGPAPKQGNTLKVLLIAGGVLLALVVLGIASSIIFGIQVARHSRVTQEGSKVKVETPFGTVESNQDAEEVARNLGVEVYPGARPIKNGSAIATMGGMKTVTARFESDDPADRVAEFYKNKFPDANITQSGGGHYAIVQTTNDGALTISITSGNGLTEINIANVQKGGNRTH